MPRVEQADVQLDIIGAQRGGFADRVHGLGGTQAEVPKFAQENRDAVVRGVGRGLLFDDKEQVDVGRGKQLPASVAADGGQGNPGGVSVWERLLEETHHHPVHRVGALANCFQAVTGLKEALPNGFERQEHLWCVYRHKAPSPRSSLRMRTASSIVEIKILPSPSLPVRAASPRVLTVSSRRLSGTTTSSFTFGRRSTVYSWPR